MPGELQRQCRRWCLTFFYKSEDDLKLLVCRKFGNNECTFILYGLELCPTTGRPHAQCYVEFKNKTTTSGCQKFIPHATYKYTNGTVDHNRNYCFKIRPEDPVPNEITYEEGTPMQQGRRTDLEGVGEAIVNGMHPREVAEINPGMYVRYFRGFQALHATIVDRPRNSSSPKNVIVYFGPTGTGKTRTAIDNCVRDFGERGYYKWHPGMGKWWDGYDNQRSVVMDEFRGQLPYGELFGLLDRYPISVAVKGGFREFTADTIYITSPKHPEEWYSGGDNADNVKAQLMRRITQITFMDTPMV
jgi:hypothetical protein